MSVVVETLRKVLRYGHHEAIAVTVNEDGSPHAAAMGVRTVGEDVVLYPYVDTRTFRNIRRGSLVSLALTHNSLIFCDVVTGSPRLKFKRGKTDGIYLLDADVDFYIEATPRDIEIRNRVASVFTRVLDVYEGSGSYFSYSRANSMLIEALVYFTKIRAHGFTSLSRGGSVSKWFEFLEYSASIVRRLGSEELVKCVERIYEELKKLGMRIEL
ncbi:MAG: DUF447 family protein [Sulfolobales archaeon]|nr:DUF447 family protein [Sulfolobales archaeon]MCX8208111.1 DUF447 family protein [Sulfolobales archaeon]MDW8010909.1 DUF447 family protein [Sulfolobales archaeon]